MEILDGKITSIGPDGIRILIPSGSFDPQRAALQQWDAVQVGLPDGRTISPEQRRKAYAIIGEIAIWAGYSVEEIKLIQKHDFIEKHLQGLQKQLFSLSNCDMTTAREFISYLVDFVVEFGVPTKMPLTDLCDDIDRYIYACLTHKKCCICGKDACVHHCGGTDEHPSSKVGMGRNRKTIIHEGLTVMPLCWGVGSHHAEVHNIPESDFEAKYHIHGIPATKEICKIWGLKHECE